MEYRKQAVLNVQKIWTKEARQEKTKEEWLSAQIFVDEFILETHLSQEVYQYSL